ncbi:MAG: hypothetical protein PVJ67_03140 [Candidatus Pacearchaeota archaeon]|jgi:hypothetical protein
MNSLLAVSTGLEIENSPPFFVGIIPNQSWSGGNLLGAFDLDDYFGSAINATLIYSSSVVEDITIVISEGEVSFYPNDSFSGIREIIFYADDGAGNASSNVVSLFIAVDDEPPKWNNPEKDKGVIYQNDYVVFSANWTDNLLLKNYTLFVNQSSSSFGYNGNFAGLTNESTKTIQISASSGQIVSWYFCARDSSSNSNCTDVKNFSVSARVVPPSTIVPDDDDDEDSITAKIKKIFKKDFDEFKLSVSSFFVSVKQGSAQTKILEITNTGNTELPFNFSVDGLGEFVILSHNSLVVSAGETKKITIDFFAKKETIPGHYFGEVLVESVSNLSIPIVFEVNPLESDIEVSVLIPEKYKFVKPGETIVANISLENLGDLIEETIGLHFFIIDFYGRVYDSSDEEIVLTSPISLMRNFTLPEDMSLGDYLFYARAFQEDSILSISSDEFEVGARFKFLAFVKSSSVFLLIVFLSFFSILFVLRYKNLAERKKGLNLYVESLELRKLMAMKKFDEAVNLFIKMKNRYGEPVTKEMLENKEALKIQMENLAQKFDLGGESGFWGNSSTEKTSQEKNVKEGNQKNSDGKENNGDKLKGEKSDDS